ncbi:MAG: glycosyltransferase family 4 protein [Alphaproteobacteria bacterium]|jgi:phosphatidylinositol alpha-mannosyltransferase|nr:glycosyltransferase family 4 protein [Alphaproteobacteria bacterium]
MKIGVVCPYDIHRPGGVQTHIRDCVRTLKELGHVAKIIAPGPAPKGWNGGDIIHLGAMRPINFNETRFEITIARGVEKRQLETVLRDEAFDVLHFHTMWTPIMPFQLFRRSTCANVATFHDTPPPTLSGFLTRQLFRLISLFLLPRLDGVIAVSEAPARHLVGQRRCGLHILPPCTDLSRYSAPHQPIDAYRDGKLNVLYLSRLERRKGIYQLLDAHARLRRRGLDARLIVVGDGEDAGAVRDHVAAEALPEVVLLGRVSEEDKLRLLATCDIFCAPSLHGESFGIVLVEAMASGKPVAAAANLGYRSVLTDEAADFLTRPGDADDLADKLAQLLQDAELRRRLGEWGRREAERYDCGTVVPQLVEIYENALAHHPTR